LRYPARRLWRTRDAFVKLSWLRNVPQSAGLNAACSPASARFLCSSRWGLDRRAIGPAGKEAILQFAVGVEFVRQKPADHEQNHDNAQRNEGTAAAAVLAIMVRHAKAFVEYFGLTH
jgi:hypothetical protein